MDATVVQEGTQRGRSIQKKQATIGIFSQIAGESNTSGRTVHDYLATSDSGVVRAMTCHSRTGTVRDVVKPMPRANVTKAFRRKVAAIAQKITSGLIQGNYSSGLLSCLSITKEIWNLKSCKTDVVDQRLRFLKKMLGPCYEDTLPPALLELQKYAMDGYGWQYVTELGYLARYCSFQASGCHGKKIAGKNEIGKTYQMFINYELKYLDHIKDFPLRSAVEHACNLIDKMLSADSPHCRSGCLQESFINDSVQNKKQLLDTIRQHMDNGCVGRTSERLEESERMAFSEDAGIWAMREYYDELKDRFGEVLIKITGNDVTDQQRVCLMETLAAFCDQYPESVGALRILRKELKVLLSDATKLILLAITTSADSVDQLKLESLELISRLDKEAWLDEKAKWLYFRWQQTQSVMMAPVGTEETAYTRCKQQLEVIAILSCVKSQSRDRSLMAADMLKELLDRNARIIDALDKEDALLKDIKAIKNNLCCNLYLKIIAAYNKLKEAGMNPAETDSRMYKYQPDFVKLQPYVLLLMDNKLRSGWQRLACNVWRTDFARLSQATSLIEDDFDTLLRFRDVSPTAQIQHAAEALRLAMVQFFKIMKAHNIEGLFIEKTMRLSQWIDDMVQDCGLDPELQTLNELNELNEEWKRKYGNMVVREKAMASSSSQPPASLADFVAMAQSSVETSSHPAPALQPLTAPPGIPVPVARWSSQLLVPLADSAVMAQSSVETSSHPAPALRPLTAPPGIPVPIARGSSQPLVPLADAAVMAQSSVETSSHPAPVLRSLTAPPGIPVPIARGSSQPLVPLADFVAMAQSSVETSSHPAPTLQPLPAYHEVSTGDQRPGQPMEKVPLSPISREPSSMPIQDKGDRQQPGVIIKHEPARSRWTKMQEDPAKCSKEAINRPREAITMCDALSAKVTFVFANNSTLALRLHQYRPIDYGATAMDNSQMVHGQECLLYATGQYLRQRDNGLYDAVSEIHLPTNCGSEQFPVLLRGVRSLTNWLLQANGELTGMDIDEETVHATLMKLGSDDGKPAIHELFNYFIKHQGGIGNFEIMSNLFVLRNYLLFIHSLLELKSDAWPARSVSRTNAAASGFEQTPGMKPGTGSARESLIESSYDISRHPIARVRCCNSSQ